MNLHKLVLFLLCSFITPCFANIGMNTNSDNVTIIEPFSAFPALSVSIFDNKTLFRNGFAGGNGVEISVPFAPIPVPIYGDKTLIAYELKIENDSSDIINPAIVDINDSGDHTLIEYSGIELNQNLEPVNEENQIFPGGTATLFIWFTIPSNQSLPTVLNHQMNYAIGNDLSNIRTVTTGSVDVSAITAVSLTPPLAGGPWLATGISNDAQQRRALLTLGTVGTLSDTFTGTFLPERFAIDWTKFNNTSINASDHTGGGTVNTDYFAYGEPVLASVSGVVVATRNTFADNPTPPLPQKFAETFDRSGNYIVIEAFAAPGTTTVGTTTVTTTTSAAASGIFLIYSHLQAGILVSPGSVVVPGQTIGFVGSSGDAAVPHLQFDVVNMANPVSPFLAQGIPYTYKVFTLLAFAQIDPSYYLNPFTPVITSSTRLTDQLPLNGMFIRFD